MSEQAKFFRRIADEQVFRLLVMVEHHFVRFAADAGHLVAAKCRMGRINVIAVRPHAAGLDAAAEAVRGVDVARPDAGAKAVQRLIGDRKRFVMIFKRRDREHRAENFFLEDAHFVMSFENRRLDIVSVGEFPFQHVPLAADQKFGAFLFADVDV